MIKQEERKTIIEKVESNYCFNNNKNTWEQVKEEILRSGGENNQDDIDLLLCRMGDSHLRAHNVSIPSRIILADLLVHNQKLYLFHDNRYSLVQRVDGKDSSDILRFYEEKYEGLPANVQYGELTRDCKFCKGQFKGDDHIFELTTGEKITVNAVEVAKLREGVPAEIRNKTFESVMTIPVDDDTVLLKLVTLNYPGIATIFEEKLSSSDVSKASNIILDLRDNQGGIIDEAEKILSLLLSKDVVMPYYTVSRDETNEPLRIEALQHENVKNKNLYVFINRYTMSAAEYVIALGLKAVDDDQVLLVGERTAGSTGQAKVFRITDECLLYVTTKRYFDENDKEIEGGIDPDIMLEPELGIDVTADRYLEWFRRWTA